MRTKQSMQITVIVWLVAFAYVLAAACSPNSPLTVVDPTPNERITPTLATQPDVPPVPTLLVPTPTPKGFYGQSYTSIGEFSLDILVYVSDVIVKVWPPSSIIDSIETVPSGENGVAPTYRPVIEFEFPVHEYLKGSGDGMILVIDSTAHTYLSVDDAKDAAWRGIIERNTEWDDRTAVLFLRTRQTPDQGLVSGASAASTHQFAAGTPPTAHSQAWGAYAVDQRGNAWMPASAANQASGASSNSDNDDLRFISDSPDRFHTIHNTQVGGADSVQPRPKTTRVSLQEIRSRVTSVAALLQSGRNVEGYEKCIQNMYVGQLWVSGWEKAHGHSYVPSPFLLTTPSGKEEGFVIHNGYEAANPYFGYTDRWFTGVHAALFRTSQTDDDARGQTGYNYAYHTTRPLPKGAYNIDYNTLTSLQRPCNDEPDISSWVVTVTAPEGTIHEAFFDPVTIGSAIGADGANGVLEPSAFTVNGTSTMLQSLKWHSSGIITLTLSPNASLSGLALDFIALDGSVALTLPANAAKTDTAAGAVTWSGAAAPWRSGDQLMLRIRNASAMPTEPTPTATATPTPTATPTLTPTPTATATPTAVPDAPPGPVSGQ